MGESTAARVRGPRVRSRLSPESWFPAGVEGITVRWITLPDGFRVRVVEAGPTSGAPILLLHGWAVSVYLWRHNILPLASEGRRVVAVDLPGHGLSDAPSATGSYTLGSFTRRVTEAMDALGLGRTSIAAQSMGAKVAVRLALDAPDRVASLVLFGPVGFGLLPPWHSLSPFLPPFPGIIPSVLVPRGVVRFLQWRVHGKHGWFTERDIDEYWAPTQFPDVVRAQLQMLKEFDWAAWEPGQLAALRRPTHVVFGTRDRTVRPVHAEGLVAALPSGRLTRIADGGHVVMEEVPDEVNALLSASLTAAG